MKKFLNAVILAIGSALAAVAATGSVTTPVPAKVTLGAYVIALYDLNPNNNTFAADLWLWAQHDKALDFKPLKSLEPENARTFATSLDVTEDHPAERYHATKVRGVFSHNWNVVNFPFDRHELRIRLSEGQTEADQLVYAADSANTGIDPVVRVEGWRIEKVALETSVRTFTTTFGEPEAQGGSTYAQGILSIFIVRDALSLFWKLHAAVYIAFLVSIVSFFMDPSKDGLFNGRVSLTIGMIFAVVINTQRVAATLGQTTAFTLAEKIHVVTLLELLCALVCALYSRHLHTSNRGAIADRVYRRMAAALALAYILVNAALIFFAARAA